MASTNPPPRARWAAGLLAAGLLALLACAAPTPPKARPNVLVLLVDTLRADALGAYGAARDTSPHFDALARQSFLFEQARSQASCTFPSVNSILTGVMPTAFFDRPDKTFLGIPEGLTSLPERLRAAGYATAAISASPIVRKTPSDENPHGGFDRGFDRFDESCLWRAARCVNDVARSTLETLPQPFFLYLHYMDPHDPYRPPGDWQRRFASATFPASEAVAAGDPSELVRAVYEEHDPGSVDPAAVAHLRDLYDDEVAYFDARLGELVDTLRSRGLLENTIVVLLADHGEAFLEHGHVKHCYSLYDNQIHTPLLIRLPQVLDPPPPRRITHSVANLDLVPTLLDYLGLPAADPGLEGRSLRPAIEEDRPVHDAVLSAWAGARAATGERYKLILTLRSGKIELFDLAEDPGERSDRSAEERRPTHRLGRLLSRWMERAEPERANAAGDENALQTLRGLGYLE